MSSSQSVPCGSQAEPTGAAEMRQAQAVAPFHADLDCHRGCFNLWGTRGSTPVPGARFIRHGGNTSCMSITYGDERFIFDAGSGIRDLGMELMSGSHRELQLFVTHTHWDHIQGFPFFTPAYTPGFHITIHGAEGFGKDLRSVFQTSWSGISSRCRWRIWRRRWTSAIWQTIR
jgi:ribonuclease BN (tRNA processing enzyme)